MENTKLPTVAYFTGDNFSSYLTKGKKYEITGFWGEKTELGHFFRIVDDTGIQLVCIELCCAHLDLGSWILEY